MIEVRHKGVWICIVGVCEFGR